MLHRSFTGSILIVAGTSIGAGMLAIPIISLSMGFAVSATLLFLMWILTAFSACLMVDLLHHQGKIGSIAFLAESNLGRAGNFVALSALLLLHFSLLSAYAAGGASLINPLIPALPYEATQVLFIVFFAFLIGWHKWLADYSNRLLFLLKLIFFACMAYVLVPTLDFNNLNNIPSRVNVASFTIFFTSFGFHGSIPVLVQYMSKEPIKRLKLSFWIGSFIPLLTYLIWEGIALSALNPEQQSAVIVHSSDLGFFTQQLTTNKPSINLEFLMNAFTLLAIITSFIGVGLGHCQLIQEQLTLHKINASKFKVTSIVFGLPILICLLYPQIFITALGAAGISLCIIAVLLPAIISWRLKLHSKLPLTGLLAFSTVIIGLEIVKWFNS